MIMSKSKIEKCDKCQEKFIRKWNMAKRQLSNINEISYWTEGKELNDYRLVCRSCLKELYEKMDELISLMSEKKRGLMRNYINMGALDKNDKSFVVFK